MTSPYVSGIRRDPRLPNWLERGTYPYQRPEREQSPQEFALERTLQEHLHAEGCANPLAAAARLIDGPLVELLIAVGWRKS